MSKSGIGVCLISIILIIIFRNSNGPLRFIPLICLGIFFLQLVFLLFDNKEKLDKFTYGRSETNDLKTLARYASLSVHNNLEELEIKQIFVLRSMLGTILILLMTLAILFLAISDGDLVLIMLVSTLALPVTIISSIFIIRQFSDRVKFEKDCISFQYDLKSRTIAYTAYAKIDLDYEVNKYSRNGLTSEFFHTTMYYKNSEEKIPILSFTMRKTNKALAKKLGHELKKLIIGRLEKVNKQKNIVIKNKSPIIIDRE